MNKRLIDMIEVILKYGKLVNKEVERLERTEQFIPSEDCFQLIQSIRSYTLDTLQTAQRLEQSLRKQVISENTAEKVTIIPPPTEH